MVIRTSFFLPLVETHLRAMREKDKHLCAIVSNEVEKKMQSEVVYSIRMSSMSRRPSGAEMIIAVVLCLLTRNRGSSSTRTSSGEKRASTRLPSVLLHTNSIICQAGTLTTGGSIISGGFGCPGLEKWGNSFLICYQSGLIKVVTALKFP